jgi:hypothetical protein
VTLAAIGLWAACGTSAPASSVGAVPGKSRPSAHGGHRCKCGMDCGATCCCAPDDRHRDSPAPRKPAVPTSVFKAPPGPCVTSAPCGGALPRGSGTLDRLSDPADRPGLASADPTASDSLLAPPASDRAEVLPGSRPDEPPERIADA